MARIGIISKQLRLSAYVGTQEAYFHKSIEETYERDRGRPRDKNEYGEERYHIANLRSGLSTSTCEFAVRRLQQPQLPSPSEEVVACHRARKLQPLQHKLLQQRHLR